MENSSFLNIKHKLIIKNAKKNTILKFIINYSQILRNN